MQDFKALTVWQKSHELTISIYGKSKKFPKAELFGLWSQLTRAASSIPTNIAEGCGRGSDKDFKRFIQIAMGSACETEYLLLLSKELNYISSDDYNFLNEHVIQIKKMISNLLKKLG